MPLRLRPLSFRCLLPAALLASLLSPAAAAQDLPDAADEALDAWLAQALADHRLPGLVAMVSNAEGVIYAGALGSRNVGEGLPMAEDSIFRIASMGKAITSVAVMMLVEEGRLSLDDPLSRYRPEFAGKQVFESFDERDKSYVTRPAEREITIRHLLTHTSGLGYTFASPILNALAAQEGAAADTASLPLLHDPGEGWSYGESTRVLGQLVEQLSGLGLEAFMRERIFVPLGMEDTFFTVPEGKEARVVTVHALGEDGFQETPNPDRLSAPALGDGGQFSTAADYLRFTRMLLNGGVAPDGTRLLRDETVALMGQPHSEVKVALQPAADPAVTRPFPLGAGRDSYGLGFQVTGQPAEAGLRTPGSLSWAGIYNTEFWIDPQAGISAVLLLQYLPFYDERAIDTLLGFEREGYRRLQ